jgi:hypothetical protein
MSKFHFLAVCAYLLLFGCALGAAQTTTQQAANQSKATTLMTHAKGTFEVKMAPVTADTIATEAGLGIMSIDKVYSGDIDGTGKGQMTATSIEGGSGAYVALEKITCTLNGHKGTFVFVHRGLMTKGTPDLSITVVPDSGTGELTGITGTFELKIEGGKHFYDFGYSLPPKP